MRRPASVALLLLALALVSVPPPAAAAAAAVAPVSTTAGLRVQLAGWLALWWPSVAPAVSVAKPRSAHPSKLLIDCGSTTNPDGRCQGVHVDCGVSTDPNGGCGH